MNIQIVKTVLSSDHKHYSRNGLDLAFFAVSNMGRMDNKMLSIKGSLGLNSVELLWDRLQRIIPGRYVRSGTRESLETEMVRGCCWIRLAGIRNLI